MAIRRPSIISYFIRFKRSGRFCDGRASRLHHISIEINKAPPTNAIAIARFPLLECGVELSAKTKPYALRILIGGLSDAILPLLAKRRSLLQSLVFVLLCTPAALHALSPWKQSQLSGPPITGKIAVASRSVDIVDVFWISNGSVQWANFDGATGWKQSTLAPNGSASPTTGIAAVSRSVNNMDVFWVGPDGSVQHAFASDVVHWNTCTLAPKGSASTTAGLAAVSRNSNTMDVWWIGPNGSVQHANFELAGFRVPCDPWNLSQLAPSGSASLTTELAALSRRFNILEVWWVGPKGSVEDRYFYAGAGWKGYTLAPPGSASPTAGIATTWRDSRCTDVWWIGPLGNVHYANWSDPNHDPSTVTCPNSGFGWTPLDIVPGWIQSDIAPAGSASTTSVIAAVSRGTGTMEVFWMASDGRIQNAHWYDNLHPWTASGIWNQTLPLTPSGKASPSGGLAALSRIPTVIETFWAGSDHSVQNSYWTAPAWTQSYSRLAPNGTANYPWLILKCTLSDDRSVPHNLDYLIDRFLTPRGAGTGNITDYYYDVSYGAITFGGTYVRAPWYSGNFDGTEPGLKGESNRYKRVELCANAIPSAEAAQINFGSYWGIIMITNHQQDGGACGPNYGKNQLQIQGRAYSLACVVFDPESLFTAFAAHEVGHGLGMSHSWNSVPCEYCDQFDIMSAFNTYKFESAVYPTAGPGLNLPNLLFLGRSQIGLLPNLNFIIPPNRISTYSIGSAQQKVVLAALSHPQSSGMLGLEIVGKNPNDIYTVEYRQADGWDAGFPNNGILIHEYKIGSAPYSYLQVQLGGSGMLSPSQQWVDRGSQVGVWFCSANIASGTATVSVGPHLLAPPCP